MKGLLKYLIETIRGFYPFLVCLVGGLFFVALPFEESGIVRFVAILLGGCCYAWAIDMAETRAKAEAESKAAAQIINALTSGLDTEFRVTINDKRQAS